MSKYFEAIDELTREVFDSLEPGDAVDLKHGYYIYRYNDGYCIGYDDDYNEYEDEEEECPAHYVICDSEGDEMCVVQTNGDTGLVFTEIN